MNEPLSSGDTIPKETFCDILRERAVLIGMEACSRAMKVPNEAIRTINATDIELVVRHYGQIRTYAQLTAWSDTITDEAKGLSV